MNECGLVNVNKLNECRKATITANLQSIYTFHEKWLNDTSIPAIDLSPAMVSQTGQSTTPGTEKAGAPC